MLLFHILTATTTLIICGISWFLPNDTVRLTLRLATTLSLLSGVLLAINPSVLNRTFCIKLGIYLLIILIAEYRLLKTIPRY